MKKEHPALAWIIQYIDNSSKSFLFWILLFQMEEYGNDNSPRAADTKVLITFKIMSNSWLGASRRWEDWCKGGDCQGCT